MNKKEIIFCLFHLQKQLNIFKMTSFLLGRRDIIRDAESSNWIVMYDLMRNVIFLRQRIVSQIINM